MISRLVSVSASLIVSLSLAALAGCGLAVSPAGAPASATPATAMGSVHGGQQPVTGATLQLYAVGASGYGSAATPLIGTTLTSSDGSGALNSNANVGNLNNTLPAGFFTITGAYTCPSASTLVYLLASGGNPGLTAGTNNSAIVLMAALGPCGALTPTTFINLNEVTTLASTYALVEYMSSTGNVGYPAGALAGITTAFAEVNNLVNISTGAALSSDSAGNAVPQAAINTLANTVVPCLNSLSPTSSACSTLFTDVSPSLAPQTVLSALLWLSFHPGDNIATIFNLTTTNPAFQPTLSSAPYDWALTLGGAASLCGYSGTGVNVTGNVSYTGASTGRIYLSLVNNNCSGGGALGTSIAANGAYNIRGVPPGTYTLTAFMDNQGYGAPNLANPTGSRTVTVGTTSLSGQGVTLVDPSAPVLTSAPTINSVNGTNTGVFASYNSIKNNNIEAATSYTLQWSTTSAFSTIAGSKSFPAYGTHTNVWGVGGLTDGSVYYFRAYGSSAGTAVGPYSSVYGPVTIGLPSSGSTVSGTVTFTGTATGPMYTGLFNQNTNTAYGEYIVNPVSPQAYSVAVPNNSTAIYVPFTIVDQNNNGIVDAGDIQNINSNSSPAIAVTGNLTSQNVTLSNSNSTATVATTTTLMGGLQTYSFAVAVNSGLKLPVTVTLLSSSNADGANITGPVDVSLCNNNAGCGKGFQISFNLASIPTVGDTYFFNVTYSDGTSEIISAAVTGVLTNFATNLAPTTGASTSTTPTFTWTPPVCTLCSTYLYQFGIGTTSPGQIWGIPNNANGLPYTTTSITWGVDPTDSSNLPSPSSLTLGASYVWSITVIDANGNQAVTQVTYIP